MTDTLTIPAHIEDGSVCIDAPLPRDVVRVEVLATLAPPNVPGNARSILVYLRGLAPGTRSSADLDAQLHEIRDNW